MTTIQEQLQRKRVPIDIWDTKEKLLLASAVVRSGDQNWMSVSRLMKTLGHTTRPSDWYSQKNCAAQYGLLLENVETPKRKKRTTGTESVIETPSESILRRLKEERMLELKKIMNEERKTYLKLKEEINLVKSGRADEMQLREMCLQIEQENKQKEREAQLYADWLKQREEKKIELERQWRPKFYTQTGQKRKISEVEGALESPKLEPPSSEDNSQETNKPAMSPLLTSLLKSPSPAPNATSSILHSAITNNNQRGASPTIASLLNSTPEVSVSPSLQQLVSTAIGQEPTPSPNVTAVQPPIQNIESGLISATLPPGLLLPDPASIKKEDATLPPPLAIPSDNIDEEMSLIEEVIKDVEENESKELLERKEDTTLSETDQSKIGDIKNELDKTVKENQQAGVANLLNAITQPLETPPVKIEEPKEPDTQVEEAKVEKSTDETNIQQAAKVSTAPSTPSIREVSVVLEDIDSTTVTPNVEVKKEIEIPEEFDKDSSSTRDSEIKIEDREETTNESTVTESISQISSEDTNEEVKTEVKKETQKDEDITKEMKEEKIETEIRSTTPVKEDITDDLPKSSLTDDSDFDESSTPLVKTEKVKRDYSRNKKKEEKEIEFLLGEDKLENDDDKDLLDDLESLDTDKKDMKMKIKNTEDRSESPWTEEEADISSVRTKRRYSTPATPSDSVPNSPASSLAGFEDDREYRAWKKSVMLVYNRMATHKYASLFLRPITDEQAPGYHNIIREPKDLQSLRRNIDNGQIKTTQEFIRYILLMLQNALMYNKTNEYVYNMAREMQNECIEQIQILVQAQAQVETPARRETRTSEPGIIKHKPDLSVSKSRKRKIE
ncbi:bromodomain-containing protein 8 [Chrysoperla carnea]|uniref:bromodomain-containing protein 8 n=1 Tax=Chrysoperla carnea TaxID=189513 RepID=UPI001D060CB1|nr:bromodomain-containing protein 8 [Chrysoperla carnea]